MKPLGLISLPYRLMNSRCLLNAPVSIGLKASRSLPRLRYRNSGYNDRYDPLASLAIQEKAYKSRLYVTNIFMWPNSCSILHQAPIDSYRPPTTPKSPCLLLASVTTSHRTSPRTRPRPVPDPLYKKPKSQSEPSKPYKAKSLVAISIICVGPRKITHFVPLAP